MKKIIINIRKKTTIKIDTYFDNKTLETDEGIIKKTFNDEGIQRFLDLGYKTVGVNLKQAVSYCVKRLIKNALKTNVQNIPIVNILSALNRIGVLNKDGIDYCFSVFPKNKYHSRNDNEKAEYYAAFVPKK